MGTLQTMDLGRMGLWWSGTWRQADDDSTNVPAELEHLGYTALWSSAGFDAGLPDRFEYLLSATDRLAVASGIASIWASTPDRIIREATDLDSRHPGRFVLGLGASHSAIVQDYSRPYSRMVEFLDELDAGGPAVAEDRRVLAALGPRMLELARNRAAGAHPYFVPVEHTVRAREILGGAALLAPEVTVVLEADPTTARAKARTFTAGYLGLPNYANNLLSLGFGEDDVSGGGSDRLVDAVVAWGDVDAVVERIGQHLAAGADHVAVQVVSELSSFPLTAYRELADAFADL
jgi:probable F420-dependent oxidoreductase